MATLPAPIETSPDPGFLYRVLATAVPGVCYGEFGSARVHTTDELQRLLETWVKSLDATVVSVTGVQTLHDYLYFNV